MSSAYLAGLFDLGGHVYARRGGGLGLRVLVPHPSLAQTLRNAMGGTVAVSSPPRWTVSDPKDLSHCVATLAPFAHGQKLALEILHLWLTNELDLDQALDGLDGFYETYHVDRLLTWRERMGEQPDA